MRVIGARRDLSSVPTILTGYWPSRFFLRVPHNFWLPVLYGRQEAPRPLAARPSKQATNRARFGASSPRAVLQQQKRPSRAFSVAKLFEHGLDAPDPWEPRSCLRTRRSGPISRVLSLGDHLSSAWRCRRPHSRATRTRAGPTHGVPICPFSGWGLPSRAVADALVRSYRTVSAFLARAMAQAGVFFSVALSVGSPRPAVSRHPALWSPDFPHRDAMRLQRGRLAHSAKGEYIPKRVRPHRRRRHRRDSTRTPPHVPADARSGSSFARRPPRVPYRPSGIPHAPHVTRRAARKTKKGPARLAPQASGASRQYMCLPGMSYFLGSFFILAKNLLYSVRHSSHWAYASSLRWSVRPYVSLSSVAIQSLTFLAPL